MTYMYSQTRRTDCPPLLLGLSTPVRDWSFADGKNYCYDSVSQTTFYMGGGSQTYSKKTNNTYSRTGWGNSSDHDVVRETADDWD